MEHKVFIKNNNEETTEQEIYREIMKAIANTDWFQLQLKRYLRYYDNVAIEWFQESLSPYYELIEVTDKSDPSSWILTYQSFKSPEKYASKLRIITSTLAISIGETMKRIGHWMEPGWLGDWSKRII